MTTYQLVTALPRYGDLERNHISDWVVVWKITEPGDLVSYEVGRTYSTLSYPPEMGEISKTTDLATALSNAFGRNGWGVKVKEYDEWGA
jgi:hypothetical protein